MNKKDKPNVSLEEFLETYYKVVLPGKNKYIREGQALMNYLHSVWPEEYRRISSIHFYDRTDIDCFYRDDLIPKTIEHLSSVWK